MCNKLKQYFFWTCTDRVKKIRKGKISKKIVGTDTPNKFWNLDERPFKHNPGKITVVTSKGASTTLFLSNATADSGRNLKLKVFKTSKQQTLIEALDEEHPWFRIKFCQC